MDKSEQPYQTLGSELIWSSPWYSLRSDRVRFPDGSLGVYNVVQRGAAVFVVPITMQGDLVLIRNYRYTVDQWLWEIVAGGIPAGGDPLETARQELAEEIGGQAQSIERIGAFHTAPGFCDELSHVTIARGVRLGTPQREASEVMEVHIYTIEQVLGLIRRGEMLDGPSLAALHLALPYLKGGEDAESRHL